MVDHGHNLRASRLSDAAVLRALISDLAEGNLSGDVRAIAIQRPPMVSSYSVRAELIDGETDGQTKPRVMLFITDPESYSVYCRRL